MDTDTYIYDEITPAMAQHLAEALHESPREAVTVRVNSPGGDLSAALAMLNALRQHQGPVTVTIEGIAASAAVLFCCVGRVFAAANSVLMLHQPWTSTTGTASELRSNAEGLDKMAESMIAALAARTGKPAAQFRQMFAAGDAWFTAQEALDFGLVDEITAPLAIAARLGTLKIPQRFQAITTENAPENVVSIQAAESAVLAREQERRRSIRALLTGSYAKRADLRAVMDECLDDPACTSAMASKRLLAKLGESCEPVGGNWAIGDTVAYGGFGESHFQAAASDALAMRMGTPIKNPHPGAKDFREASFSAMAAMCLSARGQGTLGMSRAGIIKAAMTTSDFPDLLSSAANKSLATRVEAIAQEHRQLCDRGDLVDFKPSKVVNTSFLPGLVKKQEGGEITYGSISDGAETYQLATYARGLILTREAMVNDDLDAFGSLLKTSANAAARLERDLVFGVLTANAAMSDGVALFHAGHGNLDTSGAGIDFSGLSKARLLMRKQQDSNGGYVLTAPRFVACPVGLEGDAEALIASLTYRPSSNTEISTPDWVKGLMVMADPRLDAVDTGNWYLMSDPAVAPVIRLGYLNGQTVPVVEQDTDFDRDTLKFKIRFDVACAAIGWAGGVLMS